MRFCVANTATKAAEKQNSKFEQRRPAENVKKIKNGCNCGTIASYGYEWSKWLQHTATSGQNDYSGSSKIATANSGDMSGSPNMQNGYHTKLLQQWPIMQNGYSDRRTSKRAYTVKFWQMDMQKERAATKGATKAAAKAAAKAAEAGTEKAATQGYGLKWLQKWHWKWLKLATACKGLHTRCENICGHSDSDMM